MLSTIFAKLLNLAAETNEQIALTALEGRSIAISIDEFPQDIAIKISQGVVLPIDDDEQADVDVTISGNIKAILNMIQHEETGLDSDELYIAGKISTAKQFQHFLASLSIDWEGFFGRFLPESLANKTAEAVQQGIHFAKGSAEQITQSLQDYLIDEKKLFVTQAEFNEFSSGITVLNRRLETLLDKLARITPHN